MSINTLRNGSAIITFTVNANDTVTVDEGDNMPTTLDRPTARTLLAQFLSNGYTHDKTAPAAPIHQMEKDVNRTMDSRKGLAGLSNSQEGKARDMERILARLRTGGGMVLVNYYIPVELSLSGETDGIPHGVRIANPASSFRGLGIHLDGSNWLMTADALASNTVQAFFENVDAYATFIGREGESPAYWFTPLRESEYRKFVEIADRKFATYLRGIASSLIQCIANADDALRAAMLAPEWANMTAKDRGKAENYRNNRVRSRIKKADEELASALKASEAFDMTESVADLFDALRAAIRSEREAFNAIAESAGVKAA